MFVNNVRRDPKEIGLRLTHSLRIFYGKNSKKGLLRQITRGFGIAHSPGEITP
jgi:hypothetical protein